MRTRRWEHGDGQCLPRYHKYHTQAKLRKFLQRQLLVRLLRAGIQRKSLLNSALCKDAGFFFLKRKKINHTHHTLTQKIHKCAGVYSFFDGNLHQCKRSEVCPDAVLARHHKLPLTLKVYSTTCICDY